MPATKGKLVAYAWNALWYSIMEWTHLLIYIIVLPAIVMEFCIGMFSVLFEAVPTHILKWQVAVKEKFSNVWGRMTVDEI